MIPTDLKPFSLYGLTHLTEELKDRIEILGLVINNLDLSVNSAKAVSGLKKDFQVNVFEQVIYSRNSLVTSTSLGKTIFQQREERRGNTASISALEYLRLSLEFLKALQEKSGRSTLKREASNSIPV